MSTLDDFAKTDAGNKQTNIYASEIFDGVPACEEHHMLATADLLDHVATWGDADGWSVNA